MSKNSTQTSMGEMLRLVLDNRLIELHTAMPGEVTAYYSAERACDVQPLITQTITDLEGNELTETLPIIQKVPVQYLGGSGFFIAAPLQKGDSVLIIFSENHIGNWQETGLLDEPEDTEKHGLSGAIAIPMVSHNQNVPTDLDPDDLVIGHDSGVLIHIKTDGTINLGEKSPADAIALASKVKADLDNIQTILNEIKTTFNAHNHPTPVGPSGPSATPLTGTYTAVDPKSNTVKAK